MSKVHYGRDTSSSNESWPFIRGFTTMRYINRLFSYQLLTWRAYKTTNCARVSSEKKCKDIRNGHFLKPFNRHIKTAEQRTITQQCSDWYTGRWWVGCYIWYSEEGTGRGPSPPRLLLAVQNVTAHPSTASVPTSYYSMWHYNCLWGLNC